MTASSDEASTSLAIFCTASMLRAISSETMACSWTAPAVSWTISMICFRLPSVLVTSAVPLSTPLVPACMVCTASEV